MEDHDNDIRTPWLTAALDRAPAPPVAPLSDYWLAPHSETSGDPATALDEP